MIRDDAKTAASEPGAVPGSGAVEETLRQSRRFFRATLDALPDPVAVLNEAGIVLGVNRAWERSSAVGDLPLTACGSGTSYLAVCAGATGDLAPAARAVAAAIREIVAGRRGSFTTEYPCPSADDDRWFAVRLHPFSDGGPPRLVVIHEDITEHKRIEEALRQSDMRTRAVLAAAVDGILTIDEAGTIESVNPAAERMFGYRAEELLGKNVKMLMPSPYREEHDGYMERYRRTGERRIIGIGREVEGLRRDGTVFPIDLGVSEVFLDGRRVFTGTVRDITEHRQLQAQFLQAQKMEAVGRLAGGVAHDFNTLLGAIGGYSEMLLDRAAGNDGLRRPADQIRRCAERGAALTRQLLAFSRRQVLQPKVLNLSSTIAEMGDMLRRLTGDEIDLVLDLDPDLDWVKVDGGQFEQVLMNLVVNAVDAMPHGGRIVIKAETVTRSKGSKGAGTSGRPAPGRRWVVVSVSDTGVGMDEETRNRLFEPFFTTKEPGKGTGLGLATVYGIVEQSGGRITVDSRPGEGARFVISLPSVSPPEMPLPEAPQPAEARRGTESVLLVEDDELFRELLGEVLEAKGYTVLAAGEPSEALALAEQHPGQIHLLVSDMVMPGMTGNELARHLAGRRAGLKVILMSGYSEEARGARDGLEGAVFLQKPFSTKQFAHTVRALLDGGS